VAADGDWFRASLATRSVFVQRFGPELKGFENRCVHRSYPLRDADRGNGPIVCGFHHWRYDHEGRALGIPLCDEL
jgi:phenylpropionate dioxygenase-like ring-hydroxylating dioxygenase large terminal subunit